MRRLFLGESADPTGLASPCAIFTDAPREGVTWPADTSAARAKPRTTRYVPIDTLTSYESPGSNRLRSTPSISPGARRTIRIRIQSFVSTRVSSRSTSADDPQCGRLCAVTRLGIDHACEQSRHEHVSASGLLETVITTCGDRQDGHAGASAGVGFRYEPNQSFSLMCKKARQFLAVGGSVNGNCRINAALPPGVHTEGF